MYDKLVMPYAFNQNILKKQQDDYDDYEWIVYSHFDHEWSKLLIQQWKLL